MHYLTKEDLLDLHAYVVTRYGGRLGIGSQDRLNTALHAPRQEMFGTELYPDVCSKAAVLTYLLLKNRPFVGGNEMTGLMALLRFLEINGAYLRPDIGPSELVWLVRGINNSDMDKAGLENWLRDALMAAHQPS
ncbi:MAG: type II toxin-antitoxin system death-on-curing family toxin [Chloroflexaceae bacterium]|jgi:death-on-curing protein|nr:type II toxin-antitoxin system death-on-curing family toxin [Chloroflexaceae bacterium]